MNLSQYQLAKEIHVGGIRINQIIRGERAITADTAVRLGLFFGIEPQFWMNLQTQYELEMALEALKRSKKVIDITPYQKRSKKSVLGKSKSSIARRA
jgi:addiction module HigA family antidote